MAMTEKSRGHRSAPAEDGTVTVFLVVGTTPGGEVRRKVLLSESSAYATSLAWRRDRLWSAEVHRLVGTCATCDGHQ